MWRYLFRFILLLVGFHLTECENIYDQEIYWRDYNKSIPQDALHVGYGLYIGHIIIDDFLVPGTIYPKTGKFITEDNGKKEDVNNIKIMCSQESLRFQWEYVNFHMKELPDDLLNRIVVAGYQNNNLRWYIGRAFHQNEWRIGKVDIFNFKSLIIWNNDGTLHRVFKFEILTDVNKIVNNYISLNLSSDVKVIKEEVSHKNGHFYSSIEAELDHLSEESKYVVKTMIWRVIYEVKRANRDNETFLSNLLN
nr:uncharacterized protein LOC111413816 [Onthophagus taurus]